VGYEDFVKIVRQILLKNGQFKAANVFQKMRSVSLCNYNSNRNADNLSVAFVKPVILQKNLYNLFGLLFCVCICLTIRFFLTEIIILYTQEMPQGQCFLHFGHSELCSISVFEVTAL